MASVGIERRVEPALAHEVPALPIAILLCALAMIAEGFDAYSIGFAAPIITREWGASPALLGIMFAGNVLTSALGTMGAGPVAEFYGRKRPLAAVLLAFGIATLATAHVTDLVQLAVVRTFSSLALGASVPLAVMLASDLVAPRLRGTVAAVMSASIPVGIVASSLSASVLVPAYGWPALMYAGGILALLIAVPIFLVIDEPVRTVAPLKPQHQLRALLTGSHRRKMILCLLAMTVIYAASFFFNFWLPTLLAKRSDSMRDVALITALAQSLSPIGAFMAGRAMDQRGLPALATAFVASAIVLVPSVMLGSSFTALSIGVCCICLVMNGAFGGAIAMPAFLFPTKLRATALSFSIGFARLVGGSIGPAFGGWMIARDMPTAAIALAFAPPLLIAGVMLFNSGRCMVSTQSPDIS